MIKASIAAVPGLLFSFLVVFILLAVPVTAIAKTRNQPVIVWTLLAAALSGVLSVTLLPGNSGVASGNCDTGTPADLFASPSALLNVALFVPLSLLGVLLFRRPLTVAVSSMLFSGTIEFVQAVLPLERSCSVTDVAANAAGSLIGAAAGVFWLRLRRREHIRAGRDALWGAVLAVVGAALLAGLFRWQVPGEDIVAREDRRREFALETEGAVGWITLAAKDIFGQDTNVTQSSVVQEGSRTRVSAVTDRGAVSGWWPEKTLEQAWATDNKGDEGNLSQNQVQKIGGDFARRWFAKDIAAAQETVRAVGDGPTKVYSISYRRYVNGVMMPLRLQVTVTTTGRVMGFGSKIVPDPKLPEPTVSEDQARNLGRKATGDDPKDLTLLAQRIDGRWRPVWMMSAASQDVFIDAVTGQRVVPDHASESSASRG
ncbi:VanZ family protein [Streptomyces sp. NPDC018833]|uniref:VanZ family protein n=1 Tax=Streptomyces sp. NPDC018833 TaxID=3365053 RepID=UPI0037A6193C